MFKDCRADVEKNQYKRSGQMKEEFDEWCRVEHPDFYRVQRIGSYNDVFEKICALIEIPRSEGRFLYFIDPRFLFDTTRGYRFENLTPGYERIIRYGLEELKYPDDSLNNKFTRDYNRTIDSLIHLADRIVSKENDERRKEFFSRMKVGPAEGFEEALQRILFVNQMFWQMGHRLVGLGHLDQMLWSLYQSDVQNGEISRQKAEEIICDFLNTLHEYYWLKSNVLMGDTGQIIILGGMDEQGKEQSNELTELFIQAVEKLQLPDPKILLRVSRHTDRKLMQSALRCMQTGVGSPILANDDVIIPKLIDYGIAQEDAYQYGTSACWEPLIPGKSISPNNMAYLSYPRVMQAIFESCNLEEIRSFEQLMDLFYKQLHETIYGILQNISEYRLQYNPLLSLFTEGCYEKKKDVSAGGAVYSNYGITTVGLSNTVNALLNIKKWVYDTKQYSLMDVQSILDDDFKGNEKLQKELKDGNEKYGTDEDLIIALTNDILEHTTAETSDFCNYLGGKLKFGVSAPSYIDAARDFPATFDGRKKGDAFGVHISSERSEGYTGVINFAAALNYGENRFNGNVVDLMVSPHFIEQNFNKFTDFLITAIEVGFFELQMNVVSSRQLMDAREHPEHYPNLVVRVWGFSAYFNELPEEYKEVLIQRAIENERKAS